MKLSIPVAAFAVASALLCAACGFRLAGSDRLPAKMAAPYLSLKDPYTDFSREFARALKDAGATLQTDLTHAPVSIVVTRDDVQQSVLSVSARNIPTEYELIYTVTFSVRDAGQEILPPQTLSLSRDFSFDEAALLAKEHEEDILRVQMARDLAMIALRRLVSLK